MDSVTLNSLNLQANGYTTESVVHESFGANLSEMSIPHRDGAKLTSYTYDKRAIVLKGTIINTTATLTQVQIDTFKYTVMGAMGVNLDLSYAGTTRRYKVNVKNVSLPREYYNLTFIPWTIECEAIDPPFGMDTSATTGYTTTDSGNLSASVTIEGTAQPVPQIKFTVTTKGSMVDFVFKNITTNTEITVTPDSISDGDVFIIDTDTYTVTQNGTQIFTYSGVFPDFQVGANAFTVTTACTAYAFEIDYTKRWL